MATTRRRIALVGGTAGMGFAAARVLATEGALIAILGRDAGRAHQKAIGLADETGATILGLGADSREPGALAAALDRAAAEFGGLDGVGITAGPMQRQGTLLELDDSDWLEAFEVQLMTVVRAARAALPHLIESRGALVTTAAYSVRAQKPNLPHYAAMKSAIVSLTKNIAKTYGPQGVRANCVAPGAIATEALDQAKKMALETYGPPEDVALNKLMIQDWGMKVALNRVGRPEEAGELIAFLLSGKAAYMTGALINIDGGTDF